MEKKGIISNKPEEYSLDEKLFDKLITKLENNESNKNNSKKLKNKSQPKVDKKETKKNSLAADFPHLLEAISIILTSVVIFLSCLPLCYSGPPFSLSNARRFCRRDNHRSLWFSSGLFSRMLRHCRCPLSCARRFTAESLSYPVFLS